MSCDVWLYFIDHVRQERVEVSCRSYGIKQLRVDQQNDTRQRHSLLKLKKTFKFQTEISFIFITH